MFAFVYNQFTDTENTACTCAPLQINCKCISTQTPGGIGKRKTPKMILISFDDNVNDINYLLYKELFDGRTNPNNCPISTTYFVSDIGTNYERVRDLSRKGKIFLQRKIINLKSFNSFLI